MHWRRKWQPTPVFLPGESQGWGSLVAAVCGVQSSVLAWRIPGTGEPGGLLSMGSHRVGHDWSNSAAAAAATCDWNLAFSSVMNAMMFTTCDVSPTQLQLFSCHFTELTDLPQCPFQSLVLRNYVTIRPTGLSCFLLLFIYFFGCAMGHAGS